MNNILNAFYFPEVGGMHYYTFIIRRNYFAEGIYRLFTKSLYVHKIVNDLYVFFYVEYFVGLLFKVLRNRGNGIAMVNRKCYYRRVSFIPSYKCDIRTMQRRAGCGGRMALP